jgi:hypothetical protein
MQKKGQIETILIHFGKLHNVDTDNEQIMNTSSVSQRKSINYSTAFRNSFWIADNSPNRKELPRNPRKNKLKDIPMMCFLQHASAANRSLGMY